MRAAAQSTRIHAMHNPVPDRVFEDRAAAGDELAGQIAARHPVAPLLVLGLPRGGVPVAAPVARRLGAPLDVLVVRKVGLPGQPELAVGAIGPGGVAVRNEMLPPGLLDEERFRELAAREQAELRRREQAFRAGRPPLRLRDRHVILVDDGLATGATMLAAIAAARAAGAASILAAAPVASVQAGALVREAADATVFLLVPPWLGAVGQFYERFAQVSDAEVLRLLQQEGR
jgi:predicted phosphoribosyltransferase